MRNSYYVILGAVLSLGAMACSSDDLSNSEDSLNVVSGNQDENKSGEIVRVEESMKIYSDLMDSFQKRETREVSGNVYPDYYGGGYIDDDSFLTIWVKNGFNAPMTLSDNYSVIIKEGMYSYNELNNIMEVIDTFKEQSLPSSVSANIYMWVLNEKK